VRLIPAFGTRHDSTSCASERERRKSTLTKTSSKDPFR
jgi:hypothetical protein